MQTRFKISLAFGLGSIALALLIAHWTATTVSGSEYRKDIVLLEELSRKFSADLPSYYTRPESLTQLEAAVTNLGTVRLYSIMLDRTGRVMVSGPAQIFSADRAAQFIEALHFKTASQDGGYLDVGDDAYIWALSDIPGTAYSLMLIHASDRTASGLALWIGSISLWGLLIAIAFLFAWVGWRTGTQSEKTRALSATLKEQSFFDLITGLPNRTLFIDRVRQQIRLARRSGQTLSVCHFNLDRFSNINGLLGEKHGDALLRMVGERLKNVLRDSDTIARTDADHFLILLNNIDESQVLHVSQKIMSRLHESFGIGEHSLYVRGNIGVAMYPQHGEEEQVLLQHSEIALRVAKKAGTDILVYNKKHDEYSIKHLALVNDLHTAIAQNHFELYFQPKIRIDDAAIVAVEVLLRWNHPHHGLISPDQFIPVAEQTGLIQPLTQWVLNSALEINSQLRESGIELTFSVNVSMYNLLESDFDRRIKELLVTWSIPPQLLELEITESAMMSNPARSQELLTMLDAHGIRLSIDDFGTGYSSLNYLKQLPVDELKIDKSFVLQMNDDSNDDAVVRTIIGLAHDLGLCVVAEGVESLELLNHLRRLGCDVVQGYYLCRPLPFKEFTAWLSDEPARKRLFGRHGTAAIPKISTI